MPQKRESLRKQRNFKGERSAAMQPNPSQREKAQHTTIDDLLPDLLAVVLTFLPIKECLRTTDLVNKAFHRASKHPMHWDADEPLTCLVRLTNDRQVFGAVRFCTKHHCVPGLGVELQRLPRASFRVLPRLNTLRALTLDDVTPNNMSYVSVWLSSLNQLESFSVFEQPETLVKLDTFVFPAMPRLKMVYFESDGLHTLINMDTAHLPLLSTLTVYSNNLQTSSFPDSLTKLAFNGHQWSAQVQASIAKLPRLQYLNCNRSVDILSQPDLRFTSTLTTLYMSSKTTSQARDSLWRMTNLATLHVSDLSAADVEIIASWPTLTDLNLASDGDLPYPDLSPFRHASSLKRLRAFSLPSSALTHFAHPSLTCLSLCGHDTYTISLAPLSSCVNLIALDYSALLSEQDAQVISGLTKLEKLRVNVSSEACFTPICSLPRLKLLMVITGNQQKLVGPAALQALAGLAPTIEKLALPYSVDTQATVLAVTKLQKLDHFCSCSRLTNEQVLLLRNSLPRLRQLIQSHYSRLYVSILTD